MVASSHDVIGHLATSCGKSTKAKMNCRNRFEMYSCDVQESPMYRRLAGAAWKYRTKGPVAPQEECEVRDAVVNLIYWTRK